MSLLASIQHTLRFTDEQNKLILDHVLSNEALARHCGVSIRAIQHQRNFLKKAAQEGANGV